MIRTIIIFLLVISKATAILPIDDYSKVIEKYKDLPISKHNVASAIVDLKIKKPIHVFRQFCLESRHLKSKLATIGNNIPAFRPNKRGLCSGELYKYARYPNWIYSIIDYKLWQNKHLPKNDQSYYDYLKHRKYAKDTNYIRKLQGIKVNRQLTLILTNNRFINSLAQNKENNKMKASPAKDQYYIDNVNKFPTSNNLDVYPIKEFYDYVYLTCCNQKTKAARIDGYRRLSIFCNSFLNFRLENNYLARKIAYSGGKKVDYVALNMILKEGGGFNDLCLTAQRKYQDFLFDNPNVLVKPKPTVSETLELAPEQVIDKDTAIEEMKRLANA